MQRVKSSSCQGKLYIGMMECLSWSLLSITNMAHILLLLCWKIHWGNCSGEVQSYGWHCLRTIWVLHRLSCYNSSLFNGTKFAARPESRQPAGVCDQLLVGEIVRLTACSGHCFSLHSARLQLRCCDFDDDVSFLIRIKCIPIEDWGHLKETWSTTEKLLVFLVYQSDTF